MGIRLVESMLDRPRAASFVLSSTNFEPFAGQEGGSRRFRSRKAWIGNSTKTEAHSRRQSGPSRRQRGVGGKYIISDRLVDLPGVIEPGAIVLSIRMDLLVRQISLPPFQ